GERLSVQRRGLERLVLERLELERLELERIQLELNLAPRVCHGPQRIPPLWPMIFRVPCTRALCSTRGAPVGAVHDNGLALVVQFPFVAFADLPGDPDGRRVPRIDS